MKTLKKIFEVILFVFGIKNCDIRKQATEEGICDYSGQGGN